MQQLKQSTQVKVRIGPAMDPTDGVTPVTSLTLGAADQAELLKHDGAATVDISGSTFAAVTGADGWYDLTLTAGNLDTLGMLTVVIQDASATLPIFTDFMVVPAEWYAGGIDGTDPFATSAEVGLIGVGSSAISTVADSVTLTSGTPSGAVGDTYQLDGVFYSVVPAASLVDFYFEFLLGPGNTASIIDWEGYVTTNADNCEVYAWNWSGASWDQIGTIDGTVSTAIRLETFSVDTRHTGTGSDVGKVRIRFASSGADVITNISTDRLLCSYAVTSQSVGYANGAIWIDTINGSSGTVDYFNGTADNPVDNLADAFTLSTSLGLVRFEVAQNSSLQFVSTIDGLAFRGVDYIVDLNGQQVDSSTIFGAVTSGVATGNGGSLLFKESKFGTTTLPEVALVQCVFAGDLTANDTGLYFMDHCSSAVAGSGAPSFDFAATGNIQLNMRHYSGGIELKNMSAGDTASIEGNGQVIINASCTGGEVVIRGAFKKTDNSGSVTIDDTANNYSPVIHSGLAQSATGSTIVLSTQASSTDGAYDPAIIDIITGTGAGQSRMIYQYFGATRTAVLDRDWKVTPDATSSYLVIANPGREHSNEGQAQGGTSTSITLNADASSVDDAYNNQFVFLRAGTGADQVREILDYNGTTKVATVDAWVTTPDATTTYVMLPVLGPNLLLDSVVEDNGQGTTWTFKELIRIMFTVLTGKRAGGGSTGAKAFSVPNSSPDKVRLVNTTDADGNTTAAIVTDGSDA